MSSSFYRDYSRRDWLRISLASACGVSYSGWLPKLAQAAAEQNKPRACIVLWMSGGPTPENLTYPQLVCPTHSPTGRGL
ncbi:MAG: DUF1501 domain-containing protein, partial [Planctomycetota bacterium]|nr:DUF1501 domain-containing protein [Planctomycetota bacterium]